METLPKCLVDSVSSRATGSGSCSSVKVHSSLRTPQNGLQSSNHSSGRHSISCQADSEQAYLTTMCGQESSVQRESSSKLESRKRKLSFHNACSVPARNFQLESTVHSEPSGKEFSHYQPESTGIDNDVICDDEFYQSIDLDAVEAQATELLRWSLIAGRLPGRTDNEIKNYWNTHIKRKLLGRGLDPKTHRPITTLNQEDPCMAHDSSGDSSSRDGDGGLDLNLDLSISLPRHSSPEQSSSPPPAATASTSTVQALCLCCHLGFQSSETCSCRHIPRPLGFRFIWPLEEAQRIA
ncbi:hypothetical protein B296_00054944 [Ensete ventricosum]|uniref:Uncharacterized protein n=1 Tax=Ensete ventricosum TaxID=4639 RepID=A0A426Y1N7_ENSVE|nr:hypothetical protein B296_00054944 [Ensete ventricosum]